MNTRIYIEGGGNSKEENVRCRAGFRRLFEKAGFLGNMPQTVACGGRTEVFRDFKNALNNPNQHSLMLVDSEDPLPRLVEEPDDDFAWQHLEARDKLPRPVQAKNDQVLLMATCMETWIAADPAKLLEHFGSELQKNALPKLANLESRHRHDVQDELAHATRNCKSPYKKGKRSFQVLEVLRPSEMKKHLSQFRRLVTILKNTLASHSPK